MVMCASSEPIRTIPTYSLSLYVINFISKIKVSKSHLAVKLDSSNLWIHIQTDMWNAL